MDGHHLFNHSKIETTESGDTFVHDWVFRADVRMYRQRRLIDQTRVLIRWQQRRQRASTLPVDCTDTVQRQKGAHSTCERTPYAAVRWYECVPLCVRTMTCCITRLPPHYRIYRIYSTGLCGSPGNPPSKASKEVNAVSPPMSLSKMGSSRPAQVSRSPPRKTSPRTIPLAELFARKMMRQGPSLNAAVRGQRKGG